MSVDDGMREREWAEGMSGVIVPRPVSVKTVNLYTRPPNARLIRNDYYWQGMRILNSCNVHQWVVQEVETSRPAIQVDREWVSIGPTTLVERCGCAGCGLKARLTYEY